MNVYNVISLSLRTLIKHRLLLLTTITLFSTLLCAALAAEFGGRQPATLALDVGLSALRLILPLFIVIQVQELFSKEFERKYYLLTLAYPISRLQWLSGRFLALLIVTVALLLLTTTLLAAETAVISQGYAQPTPVSLGLPLALTTLFNTLDTLVLLSLACFLAVVASTPSFVLIGTLGFMLIARSYSTVLALLASDMVLVNNTEAYRTGLGALGYLLPDLGALDVRMIALYGKLDFLPADWPILITSALFYALGFLALTVWHFQRKQFA
jgi:Cu-processing system permease protein